MPLPSSAILFGAFDRHNFGDLLFPHIAAAMAGDPHPRCAGLVERDLSMYGGHQVMRLRQHAEALRGVPYSLIHVGGEVLTCNAWEAAVMLLPAAEVLDVTLRLDGNSAAQQAWANAYLRNDDLVPYTVSRTHYPDAAKVIFHAVGGADLDRRHPAQRAEVIAKLRQADVVSVRDAATQAHVHATGVAARLIPDPAVMTAELFGTRISACVSTGEAAQLRALFPAGYIALQFSSEFDDDASLESMAAQLERLIAETGYGVALFRAGAAPWHDDLQAYRRLATRMSTPHIRMVTTMQLWEICAVVAASKLYIGSSLHGRILAMAYGLPRLNMRHPAQSPHGKQLSYAHTWDIEELPSVVTPDGLYKAALQALLVGRHRMQQKAADMVAAYRSGFALDFANLFVGL